jgi:hypothetical protein
MGDDPSLGMAPSGKDSAFDGIPAFLIAILVVNLANMVAIDFLRTGTKFGYILWKKVQ